MDNHPIENLMKSTMENIREMVDVNTIIGDPIKGDNNTLILPISKVSFGFVSGGSEFNSSLSPENLKNYPFGGGSGSGISIKPVAFLVLKDDAVRLLPLNAENTYEKIVDLVPQVMDMIKNMSHTHKCDKKDSKVKDEEKKAKHHDDNIDF